MRIQCQAKAEMFFLLMKLKRLLVEIVINKSDEINVAVECDMCYKEALHGLWEHLVGGLNLVREIKEGFPEEVMI